MTDFTELQSETREIIADLLNDGSDPAALYIIEHHVAHDNFDLLEKIALDAFKMGYEVSEAEEFEDDNGKPLFCFDIISEVEAFTMVGVPILRIRTPTKTNTVMTANFSTTRRTKRRRKKSKRKPKASVYIN